MPTVGFYRGARRQLSKKDEDSYEDFYERTFKKANIDDILEQGGGADFQTFKQESKGKIQIDLWNAMFDRTIKGKIKSQNLGQAMFLRRFEDGEITLNKTGRVVVRTGEKIEWDNKIRKGGQYLPKAYLSRKR